MVTLHAPVDRFRELGELELGSRVGVGELAPAQTIDVTPGRWSARFLDTDTVDSLVAAKQAGDDANEQLLLVHADASFELDALEKIAEVWMNAARLVVANETLWPQLQTDDGFYDHLDGVEGVLEIGGAVQVLLDGDGIAHVWASPERDVLLIDLR